VTAGWLFLAVSLVGAWLTYNVYRPHYASGRLALASFITGWLTGELALHHIAWQALATLVFVWEGALEHGAGRLALWISFASWIGLGVAYLRGGAAAAAIEAALCDAFGAGYRTQILPELAGRFREAVDWKEILHAFEIFPSLRGELVLAGVEWFLALLYGRHVARREEQASMSVAS
jgi:hypothetical protein